MEESGATSASERRHLISLKEEKNISNNNTTHQQKQQQVTIDTRVAVKKSSFSHYCRREKLLPHQLAFVKNHVAQHEQITVEWKSKGCSSTTWHGTVLPFLPLNCNHEQKACYEGTCAHKCNGCESQKEALLHNKNGIWIQYLEDEDNVYPFPPQDENVSIEAVTMNIPSRTPNTLCQRTKYASLGNFVRMKFSKNSEKQCWHGVVTAKTRNGCIIKWKEYHTPLHFPPPKSARITVHKIYFFSPEDVFHSEWTSTHSSRLRMVRKLRKMKPLSFLDLQRRTRGREVDASPSCPPASDELLSSRIKHALGTVFASWNCRGLDQPKFNCIIYFMISRGIPCLSLQETRRTQTSCNLVIPPGWKLYESFSPSTNWGGVAIIINSEIASSLKNQIEIVPGRCVVAPIDKTVVINVYMPTFQDLVQRECVFNSITAFLKNIPLQNQIVLLGDMNARTSAQIRKTSHKDLTLAHEQFVNFLQANELHASNVNFPGKGTLCTFGVNTLDYICIRSRLKSSVRNMCVQQGPFTSDHAVLLARIKTRFEQHPKQHSEEKKDLTALKDNDHKAAFLVVYDAALTQQRGKEHEPTHQTLHGLEALIEVAPQTRTVTVVTGNASLDMTSAQQRDANINNIMNANNLKLPPQPCKCIERYSSCRDGLCNHTCNYCTHLRDERSRKPLKKIEPVIAFTSTTPSALSCFKIDEKPTMKCTYSMFSSAIKEATNTLPKKDPQPDMGRTFDKDLVMAMKTMTKALEGKDDFLQSMRAKWKENVNGTIEEYSALLKTKPRLAWQNLKSITGKSCTQKMPAKSNEERLSRFHDHFLKLFSAPVHKQVQKEDFPALDKEDYKSRLVFDDKPFTSHEVREAIKTLQNNKSQGIDSSTNEILKTPELLEDVTQVLNEMLYDCLPKDLQTSILVPLPKKGNLEDPNNWRGISLMPHITKLFDLIIMLRLRNVMEPLLLPHQNGFRPNRGTVQHIMAFRSVVEHSKNTKNPLHGMFVDFSKAFDSVYWDAIDTVLSLWGVPDVLTKGIFKVMYGHEVRIRVEDSLSEPIPVEKGVLQGDTLAPYLFIIVVDALLRELPQVGYTIHKTIKNGERSCARFAHLYNNTMISFLAYADDICFFASSGNDLQMLFSSLERNALKVGLKINLGAGKTERFVQNVSDTIPVLTMDGKPIPVVLSYKYLGNFTLDFEEDLAKKRQKAWCILTKYRSIWKSDATPVQKRQLFVSLVEPILTYGSPAWSLTKTQEQRIDSMYTAMLRYALGYSRAYHSKHIHTEDLLGDTEFLSTRIQKRRLGMFAHNLREHNEGRTFHPYIDILVHTKETKNNLLHSLIATSQSVDKDELLATCSDRELCTKMIAKCAKRNQQDKWDIIHCRRAANKKRLQQQIWENEDAPIIDVALELCTTKETKIRKKIEGQRNKTLKNAKQKFKDGLKLLALNGQA